jgi:hypothetical protein
MKDLHEWVAFALALAAGETIHDLVLYVVAHL